MSSDVDLVLSDISGKDFAKLFCRYLKEEEEEAQQGDRDRDADSDDNVYVQSIKKSSSKGVQSDHMCL
jgi:hypothetical protein